MSRPRRRRTLIDLSSAGPHAGDSSNVPRLLLLLLIGGGATVLLVLALLGVRW